MLSPPPDTGGDTSFPESKRVLSPALGRLWRKKAMLTGIGTAVIGIVLGIWLPMRWVAVVQDASDRAT